MLYHIIHLPVIDLRDESSRDSEVISQAFFSEHVLVKKKSGEYRLIVTLDGYSGWVPTSSLIQRNTPYLSKGKVTQILSHLYQKPAAKDPILTLPYGAKLNILEKLDDR